VTAFCMIVAAGFDMNQGGEEEWMHDSLMDARPRFLSGF
jgi:hypothetical protein